MLEGPAPSCPLVLSPQQRTVPSDILAQECCSPAVTEAAEARLLTFRGVEENVCTVTGIVGRVVQKAPSWPEELSPQQLALPPDKDEQVWFSPVVMSVDVLTPTVTGIGELGISGKPSWPNEFAPQQFIRPLDRRAQVWLPPEATCTAVMIPETVTGEAEFAVEPLPSCPDMFAPQHRMPPSDKTAQEWLPPMEMLEAVVTR